MIKHRGKLKIRHAVDTDMEPNRASRRLAFMQKSILTAVPGGVVKRKIFGRGRFGIAPSTRSNNLASRLDKNDLRKKEGERRSVFSAQSGRLGACF
jgi:hypothetical protein